MSEIIKDSTIKLFGKTIHLYSDKFVTHVSVSEHTSSTSHTSKDESSEEAVTSSEEKKGEKAPEKPEKLLPCPRCKSMETKFCYYNNYNPNQPRYFCKKCQRYWTSGGTMRNVPVGSGRRKTKIAPIPILISDSSGFPVSFHPGTTPYWCGLGKHSRERECFDDASILKTASIWAGLGLKDEISGPGLFEPKWRRRSIGDDRAMVLQANPAAFSRSINFHERV